VIRMGIRSNTGLSDSGLLGSGEVQTTASSRVSRDPAEALHSLAHLDKYGR
jgi:hypothetical protein